MRYFAMNACDDIKYIGDFDDFSDADNAAPVNTFWIFSEEGLRGLESQIHKLLEA